MKYDFDDDNLYNNKIDLRNYSKDISAYENMIDNLVNSIENEITENHKSKIEVKIEKQKNNNKEKVLSKEKTNILNLPKIETSGEVQYLIESIICTDPSPKSFYTLSEIKNYFFTKFSKDPGNLITKELLIDICVELCHEERIYYIVEGEGNSLQLIKVSNFTEWKKKGLGSVYIPKLFINDKEIDIREFILHVYDSLNNLHCDKSLRHESESVTIKTDTLSGSLEVFNAFYCKKCHKYYTTSDVVVNKFPLLNYPFMRLKFYNFNDINRREESELMMYGYSVKVDGPSDYERQNLLSRLMYFNFLTKERIIAILRDHINYNGRKENMENAVKKWQEDLEFVQNYQIASQKTLKADKINVIYKNKKVH